MDNNQNDQFPEWTEIPELFWSDLEGEPFRECVICKCDLLKGDKVYLIEKAMKGFGQPNLQSTLFEFAICLECISGFRLKLSTSSKSKIEKFFEANVDFSSRLDDLKGEPKAAWMNNCLIHNAPVSESGECQIYSLCRGNKFCYQEYPYMIRAEAMEEMMHLISSETMDELNGLKDDITSTPPELKELLDKTGPRLLI